MYQLLSTMENKKERFQVSWVEPRWALLCRGHSSPKADPPSPFPDPLYRPSQSYVTRPNRCIWPPFFCGWTFTPNLTKQQGKKESFFSISAGQTKLSSSSWAHLSVCVWRCVLRLRWWDGWPLGAGRPIVKEPKWSWKGSVCLYMELWELKVCQLSHPHMLDTDWQL